MARLFFLVSGEHPTLPYAEVKATLEAEGFSYKDPEILPQVLCIKADESCVRRVASRSGFTRVCGLEAFRCKAEETEILQRAKAMSYSADIRGGQTFAVRVRRIRGSLPHLNVGRLESEIGGKILGAKTDVKVDLGKPDKTFFGVLTGESFVFGLKLAEIASKPFAERKPWERPFFHPSAISPKLARCMVNLARSKPSSIVYDPFCGTGSLLIEAGLIGCRVLGSDVQYRMVRGCLQNLQHLGVRPLGVVVADARKTPFRRVDCVSTDPPYGRSATTLGLTSKDVVSEFLSTVVDVLPGGGYVSISSPKTMKVSEMGVSAGFKVVETHFMYVHRSLTREIAVLRKA